MLGHLKDLSSSRFSYIVQLNEEVNTLFRIGINILFEKSARPGGPATLDVSAHFSSSQRVIDMPPNPGLGWEQVPEAFK